MKKIYLMVCSLWATSFFAQQGVSFEDSEGFIAGNIHGQGSWISTPTGSFPENVTHQIITTDNATDGSSALKIVRESLYGEQPEPIIGGFYNLVTPLNNANFSVSFDINMSQFNESVFGFQGVDTVSEQTVVRVDFDKMGLIKVLNKASGIQNLVSTSGVWYPETWYRVKVVGTATECRYYLNDILIYAESASLPLTMDQLRFVHNNGVGTAYFDNIKINDELILAVKETRTNDKILTVYPNPVTDVLTINTLDKVKNIEVYDLTGQRMLVKPNGNEIDVRNLSTGEYLLIINTEKKSMTGKFIKK